LAQTPVGSFVPQPKALASKNTCQLPPSQRSRIVPFGANPQQNQQAPAHFEIAGEIVLVPSKQVTIASECSIPLIQVQGVETNDRMIITVPPAEGRFVAQPLAPPCDQNK
jgi:hypothetical protein